MALTLQQQKTLANRAYRGHQKALYDLLLSILAGDTLPVGDFGTAGVATASKAIVLDANKALDVLTLTGLFTESAASGITAHAGGGQGSATALTLQNNRVTTVATAGDSVVLPAALAGRVIGVSNLGANALAVFPATGDAINGLAANASVTQMVNSVVFFTCEVNGSWEAIGLGAGFSGSFPTESFTNSITAHAGGGQGSATALSTVLNRVTTVVTAGDSVVLPTSAAGMQLIVVNDGANACDVFPATGDAINGQAANIQVSLKPGVVAFFFCKVAGTWNAQLPNYRFISNAASGGVAAQAETIFGTNQFTFRANSLKVGNVIKIRASGTITTANGTLELRARYGGVAGVIWADTGAAITPANGDQFMLDIELTVTDVGATGHVYGNFNWAIGTGNTATMRFNKTASIAIDTTGDKVLNITQQNGTGAGSITLDYLSVKVE